MRKVILLLLISFFAVSAFAQVSNADSLAYQNQRKKINGMLASRKIKFGEYDKSLSEHTGIFGLQTKKDIRHSNDILMDIVKTDDDIFVQLKVLLDYTIFQQKQVQSHSIEADSSNLGFMTTINKLRVDNGLLKQQIAADEQAAQKKAQTSLFIIIALLVVILLLLRNKYVKKSN
jgi:hypothetical protein